MTAPPAPIRGPAPRLRSILYTPGDRGDRLRKAWSEGAADCVLADLEDAVMPERKADARRQVLAALREVAGGPTLRGVRINCWPSDEASADLEAVMPGRPDVLAIPKCEDPEALAQIERPLAAAERANGIPAGTTRLILILETAAGVLRGLELARASPRCVALAFGAEDLAADANMRRSPSNREVAVARGLVVLAAAAAKVAAVDMITSQPNDLERTAAEAVEARGLGFTGKMCIHPLQVKAVHEAFRPAAEEVAWARRVLAAVAAAGVAEGGIVVVDGKMVDVPFIRQARRVLADSV